MNQVNFEKDGLVVMGGDSRPSGRVFEYFRLVFCDAKDVYAVL